MGGGASTEGCILQAGNALWAAGYAGNANLGINSTAGTNNRFQRVLGQSGVIEDWNCYGQGTSGWGLGCCMTMAGLMPVGRTMPTAKQAHKVPICMTSQH